VDIDTGAIIASIQQRRPDPSDGPAVSSWMRDTVGVLHSPVYSSSGVSERFAARGVTDRLAGYVARRAAPLGLPDGRPGAHLVNATFYGFSPTAVAAQIPAVWDLISPAEALSDTLDAMRELLSGLFADRIDEVVELADLLAPVAAAHETVGRPLAAAWADVPLTGEPLLDLWLATCTIRESRGDGHIALLVAADIGPLASHLVRTGDLPEVRAPLVNMRGWTEAELDAAAAELRDRGLLDAQGRRTDHCRAFRLDIERRTDELSSSAWELAGPNAVTRISDLALALLEPLLGAGVLMPAILERLMPRR